VPVNSRDGPVVGTVINGTKVRNAGKLKHWHWLDGHADNFIAGLVAVSMRPLDSNCHHRADL
jgi:hypothetical protein